MSMVDEKTKQEIVSKIVDNYSTDRIILFGSYAVGTPHIDSDIDLIVVLDEQGFSKSYSEKIERRLKIARLFYDMKTKIPMDILVYTKDEWKKLQHMNSSFIRDINMTGIQLL